MTFRHVLGHTAGLSYGATNHPVDQLYRAANVHREQSETLQTFVDKLAEVPLHYTPGERWMYSYATDVCGHLVEALSGLPLDRYFEEHIFGPLGMWDTAFSVASGKVERFAANYERGPDKTLRLLDDPQGSPYRVHPTFFSGGGGLTGTTADYLRFCEMLRRGGELDGARILGPPDAAADDPQPPRGGTGPDADGGRRVLRDGLRRRRLRTRLRDDPLRGRGRNTRCG